MTKRRVLDRLWRLTAAVSVGLITTTAILAAQSEIDLKSAAAAAARLPEGVALVAVGILIVMLSALLQRTVLTRDVQPSRRPELQPRSIGSASVNVPTRDLAA